MLNIKKENNLKLKYIKDFFKEHHIFSFIKIIVFLLLLITIGVLSIVLIKTKEKQYVYIPNYDVVSFSKEQRILESRKKYKIFRSMDKNVVLIDWLKVCGTWRYSVGGSNQFKQGDCVGAVDANLEKWGSLLPRENIAQRLKRLEKLREGGDTYKITDSSKLKTGDLIFIQISWNNPSHVGMVFDSPKFGKVRYIDVNSDIGGWNLNTINMGDSKIFAIYAMTVEVWIGDGGND